MSSGLSDRLRTMHKAAAVQTCTTQLTAGRSMYKQMRQMCSEERGQTKHKDQCGLCKTVQQQKKKMGEG